ncbi:phosphotransferase [Streptomyces sp. HNM0663]|uniref:Phosphotransferase n=1 Tax=Streptomyces chengmaiensis TaxID=3040919 RepID=A0ABT6HUC6_9ACTN|nr:phosphotransferase [Streptomyces chengmaiensis]MDH2392322.1 phosphotransferase [Streptomyces chengmaiensis]
MGRRAAVTVGRSHTVKRYADAQAAAAEAAWYRRLPWAAPRLLNVDGPVLVLQTLPTARSLPGWRPAAALWELLAAVHAEGVHHRDVHVGNIVQANDGSPLLIDWETGLWQPSALSYDLHGPHASGIAVPDIHTGLTPQWWGSPQAASIGRRWGNAGVPAQVGGRPGGRRGHPQGRPPL